MTIGSEVGDAAGAAIKNVTGLGTIDSLLKLLNSPGGQLILVGLLAHHGITDEQLDKAIDLAPHETDPTPPLDQAGPDSRPTVRIPIP